ncbi:MAG: YebC/PmpR family DNA-binding transcriptional regulator, partial [Dehalococcoidales bacterium]|nr:YebC/PmpR family DNA-binding transcriptional regulator [Dehalococcoidales bacterium]
VNNEKGYIEVYTKPEELEAVRSALEQNSATIDSAELVKVPKTTVKLDEHTSVQVLKLLDKLEELDDVQRVSSNVDFADDVLEKYKSQS